MLLQRTVYPSFDCVQPFCSPFRCSWWFGRTQNKATLTRQPGILCGWSGRLEQFTTGHSFGAYIVNVQKHAQDTSVLTFLLHWLTVSSSELCTAPLWWLYKRCYGALYIVLLLLLLLLLLSQWFSTRVKQNLRVLSTAAKGFAGGQ